MSYEVALETLFTRWLLPYLSLSLSLSLSHVSTIQNDPILSLFSDHKRKIKLTFAASEFIDTV